MQTPQTAGRMSKGKISKVLIANRGEISCRAQVSSLMQLYCAFLVTGGQRNASKGHGAPRFMHACMHAGRAVHA